MKKHQSYESPEVILIEFETERGFAISDIKDGGEFESGSPSGTYGGWD